MIVAALVALAGIALVAAGTPRQAALIASGLAEPRRRGLRVCGFALLVLSCGSTLSGNDGARRLVGWCGIIGLEALAITLLFSVVARCRVNG